MRILFAIVWEQRKYSDVINLLSGQDFEPSDYNDEGQGTPYMTGASCIDGGKTIVSRWTNTPKCIAEKGDVLLVCKGSGCGTIAVMAQERAHIARQFMALKCTDKLDNRFNLFLANSVVDEIKKDARGLIAGIARDAVLNQDVCVPNIDEQKQIGEYLGNLDNLITFHQRKYFCQYRNSNSWEQRKLGEVFEEYSEKKHEELPPLTIIQGGGTILREESDRALQYDKNSLSGYKMVKKNDFIVHLRSFEGGLEKANSDGIISPAYHTFHGDNTDSRFYYPFFRSRRFIDVLLKPHVYGIRDGKSIDIEGMKTIMIPVPSYAEQKKIGEYIESLDNLITFHRRAP